MQAIDPDRAERLRKNRRTSALRLEDAAELRPVLARCGLGAVAEALAAPPPAPDAVWRLALLAGRAVLSAVGLPGGKAYGEPREFPLGERITRDEGEVFAFLDDWIVTMIEELRRRPCVLLLDLASAGGEDLHHGLSRHGITLPAPPEAKQSITVLPDAFLRDFFCRPPANGLPDLTPVWGQAGPDAFWVIRITTGKLQMQAWAVEGKHCRPRGKVLEFPTAHPGEKA
jgi:hypothetical protein